MKKKIKLPKTCGEMGEMGEMGETID